MNLEKTKTEEDNNIENEIYDLNFVGYIRIHVKKEIIYNFYNFYIFSNLLSIPQIFHKKII